MASRRIIASFDNLQQAQRAVYALQQAGVSRRTISVAAPEAPAASGAAKPRFHFPIHVGTWGLIGAFAGVTGGALAAAVCVLTVPGFGPAIPIGALFAVLGVLMCGAIGCGMDGIVSCVEGGHPAPPAADLYRERLARGDVVVAVSGSEAEAERATAVLSPQGAREVSQVE